MIQARDANPALGAREPEDAAEEGRLSRSVGSRDDDEVRHLLPHALIDGRVREHIDDVLKFG